MVSSEIAGYWEAAPDPPPVRPSSHQTAIQLSVTSASVPSPRTSRRTVEVRVAADSMVQRVEASNERRRHDLRPRALIGGSYFSTAAPVAKILHKGRPSEP
jgi:hypothetical protein